LSRKRQRSIYKWEITEESAEVAEYVLAVCVSQIIYLVDLANGLDGEIPF